MIDLNSLTKRFKYKYSKLYGRMGDMANGVHEIPKETPRFLLEAISDEDVKKAVATSRAEVARWFAEDLFSAGYLVGAIKITLDAHLIDRSNTSVWRDFVTYAREYLLKDPLTPDNRSFHDTIAKLYGYFDISIRAQEQYKKS